jgi:SAM-dependent methyltransferase
MINVCRGCDVQLSTVLIDLGMQPISNALLDNTEDFLKEEKYPLVVYVCDVCSLVQLDSSIQRDLHFNENYTYFSSYSESWLNHAKELAKKSVNQMKLSDNNLVVELASNDGYLLQYFKELGVPVLGIEPSENVANFAILERGIPTLVEFFGVGSATKLLHESKQADLVIAINVLAHVPDIYDFLRGIEILLKDEGQAVIEFPHLVNLLRECQFDTIYHEHYSYLSLTALCPIIEKSGLKVIDIEEIPTHGGSLRLYLAKIDSNVAQTLTLEEILEKELLFDPRSYITRQNFQKSVSNIVENLLSEISKLKKREKLIFGYGAAAKGNTILNLAGIDSSQICCIIDKNPFKQGKFLPGTHIPICGAEEISKNPPDVILILPWNLASEITSQLRKIGIETPIFRVVPCVEYLE